MSLNASDLNIVKVSADQLLNNALNTVYLVGGILAVIVIIVAGYFYVTSSGNATTVEKAKNAIIYAVVGLVVIFASSFVGAESVVGDICSTDPNGALCTSSKGTDLMGYVKTIVNTMLTILGVLAVVMIIYSGITYTLSAGDAKKVEQAKNTIIYSVVGLVVALLAGVIVNFVLGVFK